MFHLSLAQMPSLLQVCVYIYVQCICTAVSLNIILCTRTQAWTDSDDQQWWSGWSVSGMYMYMHVILRYIWVWPGIYTCTWVYIVYSKTRWMYMYMVMEFFNMWVRYMYVGYLHKACLSCVGSSEIILWMVNIHLPVHVELTVFHFLPSHSGMLHLSNGKRYMYICYTIFGLHTCAWYYIHITYLYT